jgi:hypothetical protein
VRCDPALLHLSQRFGRSCNFLINRIELCAILCVLMQRHGYLCACKVFRSDGSQREELAKQREFDVMKKLSHENVVKFLAIEQEVCIRFSC